MAATIIAGNQAAKPYYTGVQTLSPLDNRQKIYIEDGDEITIDTFKVIKQPYPHLRVHIHKKLFTDNKYAGEICVGVYEIDDLTLSMIGSTITGATVKSFHQVYSTAQGTEEDYLDKTSNEIQEGEGALSYNEKYKNIIFYTETGKVYLNGILYGSEGTSSVDTYVLEFSIEDLLGLASGNIDSLAFNINNLRQAVIDNKAVLINYYKTHGEAAIPCACYCEDTDAEFRIEILLEKKIITITIDLTDLEEDSVTIYTKDITITELQEKLESGENIKTINGESILGQGNIKISTSTILDFTVEDVYHAHQEDTDLLGIETKSIVTDIDNKEQIYIHYDALKQGIIPCGTYRGDEDYYYILFIADNNVFKLHIVDGDTTVYIDSIINLEDIKVEIEVDSQLSEGSTNPVQNKVITTELKKKANTDAIPTRLLQLTNDADYATTTYVDGKIPTKTSELTNNSGFVTVSEVQENYQPKGNYITEIPSEYITNEELGKKNYATKDELTEAISNAITESINNVLNAEY